MFPFPASPAGASLPCEPWLMNATTLRFLSMLPPGPVAAAATPPAPGALNSVCTFDPGSRLAVIRVMGILSKGDAGPASLDAVEDALDLLRERRPRAVAIHFNTPGGTANGLPEASAAIRAFSREVAPVLAYTDTMCLSGGYWLAAACDCFHAAPSAYVGDLGAHAALMDDSAHLMAEGVKVHLAASGPLKASGFTGQPVTPAQLAALQGAVARLSARFRAHVTARRPGIAPAAFSGGIWAAQDAPTRLHDGLLMSRSAHLAAIWGFLPKGSRRA